MWMGLLGLTHADPIVERNSIRKAEQAGVLVLDHTQRCLGNQKSPHVCHP